MNWTREAVQRWIKTGIGEPPPVSGGKGDASKAEQANADAQRNMENQIAQQQLNLQTQQLNAVNSTVDPMIANGGLSPQMQAALQANLTNKLGSNFQSMMGTLNQNLVARGLTGGTNAGGGGVAQGFGSLFSALAGQQQQGQFDIANMQQGSLMNELGLKLGIGSQFGGNVAGFNSGATGALNAGVTAANNVDQAQTSWMGPVFGALGAIGGPALGKGGALGCWIARAVYGDHDPRWMMVRAKLFHEAEESKWKRALLGMYIAFGEQVAKLVRFSMVNNFFRTLLDRYLSQPIERAPLSEAEIETECERRKLGRLIHITHCFRSGQIGEGYFCSEVKKLYGR